MKAALACLASRSLQPRNAVVQLSSTLQALCGVKPLPAWAVAARSTQYTLECRAHSISTAAVALHGRRGRRQEEDVEHNETASPPSAAAKCEAQLSSKRRSTLPQSASSSSASASGFFDSHPLTQSNPTFPNDGLWSSTLSPSVLHSLVAPLAGYARAGLSNATDLSAELLSHSLSSGARLSAYALSSSDGPQAAHEEARLLLLLHICTHFNGRRRDTAQLASAVGLYRASVVVGFKPPRPHYKDLVKLQYKVMHAYIGLLLRVASTELKAGTARGAGVVGALTAAAFALRDARVRPTQARYLLRKVLALLELASTSVAAETWLELTNTMITLLKRGTVETWTASASAVAASGIAKAAVDEQADEHKKETKNKRKEAWNPGRELHRCLVLLARAQQTDLVLQLARTARSVAQTNLFAATTTTSSSLLQEQQQQGAVEWAKPVVQLNVLRYLQQASNGKEVLSLFDLIDVPHRTQDMYHVLFTRWGECSPTSFAALAERQKRQASTMCASRMGESARQTRARISSLLWHEMCTTPRARAGAAAERMKPTLKTFEARMKSHARARAPGLAWIDLRALRKLDLLNATTPPSSCAAQAASENLIAMDNSSRREEARTTSATSAWLTRLTPTLTRYVVRTLKRANRLPAALHFTERVLEAHSACASACASASLNCSTATTSPTWTSSAALQQHQRGVYSSFGTSLLNILLEGALARKCLSRMEQRAWDRRWDRIQLRRKASVVGMVRVGARTKRFFGRGSGRRTRVGLGVASIDVSSVRKPSPLMPQRVASSRTNRLRSLAMVQLRPLLQEQRPLIERRNLVHLRAILRLAHAYGLPFDGISRSVVLLALAHKRQTSAGELRELLRLGFGVGSAWADECSRVLQTARRLCGALDAHDTLVRTLSQPKDTPTHPPPAQGNKAEREIKHVKLPLLRGLVKEAKKRPEQDIAMEMVRLLAKLARRFEELRQAKREQRDAEEEG